ncbi:MAG: amidohydrolase family protein, partial [Lentisphaeria bacterium]
MKSDPLTIAARRREPLPFAPIIDIHGHCGPGAPFPIFAETPDLFLQEMDRLGVSRLYASSYAGLNGWASHGNADALAFQQAAPGRLFGYMTIDPLNSPAEVDNTLEQAYATGLRMLKIHASMGRKLPYSAPAYQQAFTWADAHNVPVLAHTWGIELPDLEPLAKKHPGLILILAHAGATQPEEYIRLARS